VLGGTFSVKNRRCNAAPGVHAQTSSNGADDEGRHRSDAGTEPPADRATHGRTEESEELGHGCSGNRADVAEEDRSWSSIQDVPNLSQSISSIFMKI